MKTQKYLQDMAKKEAAKPSSSNAKSKATALVEKTKKIVKKAVKQKTTSLTNDKKIKSLLQVIFIFY